MTSTAPAEEIADRWRTWAATANGAVVALRMHGEHFEASLRAARAAVRRSAADLLRSSPEPDQAARTMMRQAVDASVRVPPLLDFDEAAINYTAARTWQACAWEIDPTLPEVQPRWP